MLIKDWEYWEDKLSMGHMALFIITYLKKKELLVADKQYQPC